MSSAIRGEMELTMIVTRGREMGLAQKMSHLMRREHTIVCAFRKMWRGDYRLRSTGNSGQGYHRPAAAQVRWFGTNTTMIGRTAILVHSMILLAPSWTQPALRITLTPFLRAQVLTMVLPVNLGWCRT
jgi:hypothetical protein